MQNAKCKMQNDGEGVRPAFHIVAVTIGTGCGSCRSLRDAECTPHVLTVASSHSMSFVSHPDRDDAGHVSTRVTQFCSSAPLLLCCTLVRGISCLPADCFLLLSSTSTSTLVRGRVGSGVSLRSMAGGCWTGWARSGTSYVCAVDVLGETFSIAETRGGVTT